MWKYRLFHWYWKNEGMWKNRQWKSHDLEVMADALPSLENYCRNPDNDPRIITDWFFHIQSRYLCTCDCILRGPTTAAIQTTIVVVRGVLPTTSPIRWNTATSLVAVRVTPFTDFTRQTVFPRCSVHAKFPRPSTASTRCSHSHSLMLFCDIGVARGCSGCTFAPRAEEKK